MSVFVNALLNTIMGMGTVFIVLIFISLIISLFKFIPELQEKLQNRKNPAPVVEQAPVAAAVVEEEEEEELVDDGELVAVIMAAIMAAQGNTANSADKLVVRSIKRARTARR